MIGRSSLLLGLISALGWSAPAVAQKVAYTVSLARPGDSRVHVTLSLPDMSPGPRFFVVPRAVPMGYTEVRYDRFVENLKATDKGGAALAVERQSGPRWQLGNAASSLRRVEYDVNLDRMEDELLSGSESSKARPQYVGLLGYSIFGYVDRLEGSAASLEVAAPEGWPVFSTLSPRAPAALGSLRAEAADFYALADSQVAMGPALVVRTVSGPVPAYLALYSETEANSDLVAGLAGAGLRAMLGYFGAAPFGHFAFLVEVLEPRSKEHEYDFSIEHLESVSSCFQKSTAVTTRATEAELLRHVVNFAHHAAHAWIPKRSYGEGYVPFSWELAPVLDTIWFSEGFAQYAAMDALIDDKPESERAATKIRLLERFRKGLADAPDFLKKMPLVTLSRIGSTRYGTDFRVGRTLFSRGGLMAAEMDDAIRTRSKGQKRLRDALRALVEWSAKSRRGFKIEELPGIFQAATGVDVRDVLDRWLAPMP